MTELLTQAWMSTLWDPKQTASIIWQYWFRTIIKDDTISIKDITNIIIEYYNIAQILKWSKKYKSKTGFEFSNNDTLITRIKDQGANACRWISPDIDPVNTGIHCWRVNVNNTKHVLGRYM